MRGGLLRRLVMGSVLPPCYDVPIALLGTETGYPVSNGRPAVIVAGDVVATGAGYTFVDGALAVDTKAGCAVAPDTTFSISGVGPIPALTIHPIPYESRYIVGIINSLLYVAYPSPAEGWALKDVPVAVAPGLPYSLVVVVAPTYVRAWLNGVSIGRNDISPDFLGPAGEWRFDLSWYIGTHRGYTGYVSEVKWEVGALYPDTDNI